jgi:hypothetical protein
MRRLVAIAFILLGAFACKQLDYSAVQPVAKSEIVDLHKEQIACNHQNNNDVEQPSQVVVPTAQIRILNGQRTNTFRAPHIAATGHFYTTSKYVVAQFIHRLGSLARAIDFYLYTLCRLRL